MRIGRAPLLVLAGVACAPGRWNVEVVDDEGNPAAFRLAIDAGGGLHVAYYRMYADSRDPKGGGRYAYRGPGGGWVTETLRQEAGGYLFPADLALDPSGCLHIAARDDSSNELVDLSRCPGGPWVRRVLVPSLDTSSAAASLAVDAEAVLHVSYQDLEPRCLKWQPGLKGSYDECLDERIQSVVKYLRCEPDAPCLIETVDSGEVGSSCPSIAVDGSGAVHVTYERWTLDEIRYARRSPEGVWEGERLAGGSAIACRYALALDGGGGVHVVFHRATYAYRAPGADWSYEIVGGKAGLSRAGAHGSFGERLAVDAAGGVHVTFSTNQDGDFVGDSDLGYAYRSPDGAWSVEIVESDGVASIALVAVDGSACVHLIYSNLSDDQLKHAWRCPAEDER